MQDADIVSEDEASSRVDDVPSAPSSGEGSPLRDRDFRIIIYATGLSLCAFWMSDVACSWLMREMTDGDPFLVSLVQFALQFPIMLVLLPAGVLSDLLDRVLLLVVAQLWLILVTSMLVISFGVGVLSPGGLLLAVTMLGVGSAIRMPNVNALVLQTVSRTQISAALSMTMAVVNGSRIVGPAVAGLILSVAGVPGVFVVSLVLLIVATVWARQLPRRVPSSGRLRWRDFHNGLTAGIKSSMVSREQRRLFLTSGCFAGAASVVIALLPVMFDTTAHYGAMYACYGAGAMCAAVTMARSRSNRNLTTLIRGGVAASAVAMLFLAVPVNIGMTAAALFMAGAAWIVVLNASQIAAALSLKNSERGRGLSMLYVAAVGGMALVSPVWGWIAKETSPSTSFLLSAIAGLLLAVCISLFWGEEPAPLGHNTSDDDD